MNSIQIGILTPINIQINVIQLRKMA